MRHGALTLAVIVAAAGCRIQDRVADRDRTASTYSSGSDSGNVRQQIKGTNTGVEFEAPRRIPGVLAALSQVSTSGGSVDQSNATALRGDIDALESAMRDDLRRAGLADTGKFHDLADSIVRRLGGGAGNSSKSLDAKAFPELSSQVHRLVDQYNAMMRAAHR